jgi:hypothetical protein
VRLELGGQLAHPQLLTAGAGPSHVGIATGRTTVVSATNAGVIEHATDDAYWGGHYVGARRLAV